MDKLQNYRLKGKEIFVGLEDSKRSWKLCIRCEKMIMQELSMPAKYEGLWLFFKNNYPKCRINVMYEAGFSGFWLHDALKADGVNCVVTPAHSVTQEKVNMVKTDKVDARRLAKNLENGDYKVCHVPDKERREDRQISRSLDQIKKEITANKNRVRKFLDYHGLNGEMPVGRWRQANYGKLKELRLRESLQVSLDTYLTLIGQLEAHAEVLKKELKKLSEKERYRESVKLKMSSPGVGWYTATKLTLELGDMKRFKTGKHIGSYVGLTSREHSSGEQVYRGRITGQGSGTVRASLIQCAWRAIRIDQVLLDKFMSVWQNSGSKKKAIVAVARKLIVRIWRAEVAGQPYCLGVVE